MKVLTLNESEFWLELKEERVLPTPETRAFLPFLIGAQAERVIVVGKDKEEGGSFVIVQIVLKSIDARPLLRTVVQLGPGLNLLLPAQL